MHVELEFRFRLEEIQDGAAHRRRKSELRRRWLTCTHGVDRQGFNAPGFREAHIPSSFGSYGNVRALGKGSELAAGSFTVGIRGALFLGAGGTTALTRGGRR